MIRRERWRKRETRRLRSLAKKQVKLRLVFVLMKTGIFSTFAHRRSMRSTGEEYTLVGQCSQFTLYLC